VGAVIAAWDGWRGNMYRLAVRPDFRRRGVGEALVQAGHDVLALRGARRITALVAQEDAQARGFWASCGYDYDDVHGRFVANLAEQPGGLADDHCPVGRETGKSLPAYWVIFEMTSPEQLREARPPLLPIELEPVDPVHPTKIRETYLRVWQPLGGGGRSNWSDQQWTDELTNEGVYAWTTSVSGETAGLLQLEVVATENYAEIVVVGLAQEFIGRGFGGPLVATSAQLAWNPPDGQDVSRIGLATLFPEHPNAIPTYITRGFRLVRTEPKAGPRTGVGACRAMPMWQARPSPARQSAPSPGRVRPFSPGQGDFCRQSKADY
jgi:GNAT superfamily N-acetyltransferase